MQREMPQAARHYHQNNSELRRGSHLSAWMGPRFSGTSLSGGISGIFCSGSKSGKGGIISGSCFLGSPFIAFTFFVRRWAIARQGETFPAKHSHIAGTSRDYPPTLEQKRRPMPPLRELVVLRMRSPHSLSLSLGAHTITGAAWEPFLFRIVCLRTVASSCFRPTTHLGRFCKSSKMDLWLAEIAR